jgi:hypothetical protein
MIKITEEIEKFLINKIKLGHYSEQGAVVGDEEFILVYIDNKIYLAHKTDFEYDGMFIRLKYFNYCPCHNCCSGYGGGDTDRIYTCHDTCKSYQDWKNNVN